MHEQGAEQMDEKKASLLQIIRTDYPAALCVIVTVMFWGIWAFDEFAATRPSNVPWLYIAAAFTIIGFACMAWRVRLIQSAFEEGREVEGDVLSVSFFRDRGRVSYVYTIDGQKYESSNAVMRHSRTRGLRPGQKVVITANRDNPKIAFIKELYR
jgi:hypothetical protein